MAEIRNLTRNGETFYPLTHEKAVIGMEDFKDTITEQIDNYRPIEITGDVTNAPDEEDITSDANNLLKFKNRNNLYGLGRIILRRGSSFASQVTQANTIYVIQYNFDLDSGRVNIPNSSILLFEGGSLSNGTLVCADLYDVRLVYYQDQSEILSSITLEGNFIHKACDKDTIREILVDNSSITKDVNDVLSVKANGIQNSHLNSNTVDNSSIALDSNNKISIKDGGVTGNKLNSGVVNTDDLSIVNNKIQFANRGTTNGMGKIILRKDQSFASQLTQQNTIYVVQYDFDLGSTQANPVTVTIPENCVLQFDGGSLSNGTITGNNTGIEAGHTRIFSGVILRGDNSFNVDVLYTSWWITNIEDNTEEFQNLLSSITAFNNKNICIENNIRITDGNLTNKYTRGIKFYSNIDYAFKQVGITVFGGNSQGLDISGCEGVEFKNVLFIGDNNNPPKTLLYSSRTQSNPSAWYHRFINCWFSGSATKTLLYNYAGECWELVNCQFRPACNMECVVYFTATNGIGLTSKFTTTASAPNYLTPLSDTSFKECSFFNYEDNPMIVFEANASNPNTISSEIGFYHCYFKSTKHNTVRFIGITSNISFINCTDESGVGYNPSVYTRNTPHYEFLNYDNAQISWLTSVVFSNNNLYGCIGVSLITCNNYVRKLITEANNYSGYISLDFYHNVKDSIFNDLDEFTQLNIATSNNCIVNTSDKSKINIGSTIKEVTKNSFNIIEDVDPYEHYDAAENAIVKRSIFELYYLGAGTSIYDWKELAIKKYTNLFSPTRGLNFKKGQVIYASDPLANGFVGAVATSDGTTGNLNVTFSTVPGTNTLVVSDTSDLIVGQSLYITNNTSLWINRVITNINSDTNIVTFSGTVLNIVINDMPLYWASPNLRPFGMLCILAANNSAIETTSLIKGFGYFNTTTNQMNYWTGSAWVDATGTPI